jgi:hypothetical protein
MFKTKVSKGKPKVYKYVKNQLNGELRLVRYWHGLGRKVHIKYVVKKMQDADCLQGKRNLVLSADMPAMSIWS